MEYIEIEKSLLLNAILKPSEFRPFVKNWDKSRWKKLFTIRGKVKYRIYLPLIDSSNDSESPVKSLIEDYIKSKGYTLKDYADGLAINDKGRAIKVGKILKDNQHLLKKFVNDPYRIGSKLENFLVVVSRHPYDIAGMSSNRGWTSCMDLEKDTIQHRNKAIKDTIKSGALVAYLIRKNDLNINHPLGRILLKPYVGSSTKDTIFNPSITYGTVPNSFLYTVNLWAKDVIKPIDLVYKLNKKVYQEQDDPSILTFIPDKYKNITFGSEGYSPVPVSISTSIVKRYLKIIDKIDWLLKDDVRVRIDELSYDKKEKYPIITGKWAGGTWENGRFEGVFENGVFKNGVYDFDSKIHISFRDSVFENGIFESGVLSRNSVFTGGEFYNGVFNGTFKGGVFRGGDFGLRNYKQWQGGTWIKGNIVLLPRYSRRATTNDKRIKIIDSKFPPNVYTPTVVRKIKNMVKKKNTKVRSLSKTISLYFSEINHLF